MPSMNDIAKIAGVSKATVSLALADHPRISEETKLKIKTIAQNIGYLLPSLKSDATETKWKASRSIGVLYIGGSGHSTGQGFFRDTLMGICGEGSRSRVNIVMIGVQASDEAQDAEEVYGKVAESGVDGIIVITCKSHLHGFRRLAEREFPMVFVGSRRLADWDNPLHSVASDNYDGGVTATEYLLKLGHTRIAAIMSHRPSPWETDRLNGYFAALRAAGVELGDDSVIRVSTSFNPDEEGWKQLQESGATAAFATTSLLGHMALQHSRIVGKSVPGELSLVSFDDTASFPYESPPVTIIEQDMESLGTLSAKMLFDLIESPGQPARQVLISTRLVERASCVPLSDGKTQLACSP
ncbi:LacI family transcriptional regulator [Paenibacillus mesophilus]|uniref:LacI family DNA-binding transcriptional regulator n=1 Tax=Paenibacillus mesophilus TaxID=2582849 RepID=UPI00110F0D46|nr:LacI family DNA-binding transcriptional regulator [Paenibacillus mesophilus]TMV45921.1 LacI family transcriptional regulator [Paenibacillus mesophilus]